MLSRVNLTKLPTLKQMIIKHKKVEIHLDSNSLFFLLTMTKNLFYASDAICLQSPDFKFAALFL